jgi:hypothetical protein
LRVLCFNFHDPAGAQLRRRRGDAFLAYQLATATVWWSVRYRLQARASVDKGVGCLLRTKY